MQTMVGIQNINMLTQLPGSMSNTQMFVRPDEVSYYVVLYVSWMEC